MAKYRFEFDAIVIVHSDDIKQAEQKAKEMAPETEGASDRVQYIGEGSYPTVLSLNEKGQIEDEIQNTQIDNMFAGREPDDDGDDDD